LGIFGKTLYFVAQHPGAQGWFILEEQIMTVGTLIGSTVDTNKIVQVQLSLKRRKSVMQEK
jgi:hypothetical protein